MQVRRTLALALATLLLTGCGLLGDPTSEPTPIFPDPTTPTRTPSPSPTVDPLAIPDAMRDKSLDGAEAAVQHYFDMYNHLIETGDAKPIKKLYGNYCVVCSGYVSLIELSHKEGNSTRGRQVIKSAEAFSGAKGLATVLVEFRMTPIQRVAPSGEVTTLIKGSRNLTRTYNVSFQKGMWRILRVEDPQ